MRLESNKDHCNENIPYNVTQMLCLLMSFKPQIKNDRNLTARAHEAVFGAERCW